MVDGNVVVVAIRGMWESGTSEGLLRIAGMMVVVVGQVSRVVKGRRDVCD